MPSGPMKLGIMVTLSDFATLKVPGASFSELLLFDGELGEVTERLVEPLRSLENRPVEFVHVQEYFKWRGKLELVDLSSGDEGIRRESVGIVSRTRDLAMMLGAFGTVVHPGGIRSERVGQGALGGNLRRSLSELGPESVLLENMPWHYWLRSGERMVSNVCISTEDVAEYEDLVQGFVLDTSHGFLSSPEGDPGYSSRFLGSLGRRTQHVHASDAKPPDGEGLQIGEGFFDFSILRGLEVPILVEVWEGHAQDGAGFRLAIDRLRSLEAGWGSGSKE